MFDLEGFPKTCDVPCFLNDRKKLNFHQTVGVCGMVTELPHHRYPTYPLHQMVTEAFRLPFDTHTIEWQLKFFNRPKRKMTIVFPKR
jgi:hypothetical protein